MISVQQISQQSSRTLNAVTNISVDWIVKNGDEVGWYSYRHVDSSLVANNEHSTLRFELTETHGADLNFEVLIKKTKDGFVFCADCNENPSEEYLLKPFVSNNEIIMVHENRREIIYFHLK